MLVGLFLINGVFVTYIGLLLSASDFTEVASMPYFVLNEMICMTLGMVSSIALIGSISFTVIKLRQLFPGKELQEKGRITKIAIIFGLSILCKSVFEWTMYYNH